MSRPHKLPKKLMDEICARLVDGERAMHLAKELGVNTTTVCRWAEHRKIERTRGAPKDSLRSPRNGKIPIDLREEIIELWFCGYSLRELARMVGCSHQGISQTIHSYYSFNGIEMQNNTWDLCY